VIALTAFVLEVCQVFENRRLGTLAGVPLPLLMMMDTGFLGFDATPKVPLPMLPDLGVDRGVVLAMIDVLRAAGLEPPRVPTPDLVRAMLLATARPMEGYESHQVGAGFVSDEQTLHYLRVLSAWEYLRLSGLDLSVLTTEQRFTLQRTILCEPGRLEALFDLSLSAQLMYVIDWRTGEIQATMRDPGMTDEPGFVKEPNRDPWPPPLDWCPRSAAP
jgi:hypothetical protein